MSIGAYFTATVRADGLVEFRGGVDGPYPADPTGWRALAAHLNNFASYRALHIYL